MKKKIVYINDVPKQFSAHQDFIKERINYLFDLLELDCKLRIKFIESASENDYEYTDCAVRHISVSKHELLITNFVLNSINCDGGDYFCISIYHELEHIVDHINMVQTKLFRFNLSIAHQKTLEKQYVSVGYHFWTEIYAYYQTIEFAKFNTLYFEKIPFGRLVTNYIKTINLNDRLYYKKDLSYDEVGKYIDTVDSYIYLMAKYLASAFVGHSRMPRAKIDKNKNYKKVYSMLSSIEPKVIRLLKNPYSAKSYDNLFRLGKYICENVRWKIFNVGLKKKGGKIYSFY